MSPEPARRSIRIGLTGPIGCGKSTVAGWLGELGAAVIDADRVARDVTAPGTDTLRQVAATFGTGLLRADGSLDRGALGRIVFTDPAALAALEAIVHPAVRPAIVEAIANAEREGAPAVAIEAIKLVEGGLAELCDEVWLITCARDEQAERVRARLAAQGADPGDADARIEAQDDMVRRVGPSATRVIDTTGSLDETRAHVFAAWSAAMAAARR